MNPADLEKLRAAGLYDPEHPSAKERLALLEWLSEQGATLEDIIDAPKTSTLTGLAGDLILRADRNRLTLQQVAALSGMSPERLELVRRAAGLPPVSPGERRFTADEAPAFAAFEQAANLFGEEAVLNHMRVMGTSLSRIAEASVSLFLVNVEGPIVERQGSDLDLARANVQVMNALQIIPMVMNSLLRAHVETAIRRMRNARHERSVDLVRMAVGFVDLVGFTTVSHKLTARELAEVVQEFEALAHDLIVASDGRLVKLIGDEVMFVVLDPSAACDIALKLVEHFADDPLITPRGGLAFGPLLMRGGDYFGPNVNLASRMAELAVPREVLVTEEVARLAGGAKLRFEPAGKRMLKGFDEPVALYAAVRA